MVKKLIALTSLALLTGCASPNWKTAPINFNCIDYANAYSRELISRGYECGTADYTTKTGEPHRIVWLRNEKDNYIYVEPLWKTEAKLSKMEKSTLRNHIRKGYLENDLYRGTKEIPKK